MGTIRPDPEVSVSSGPRSFFFRPGPGYLGDERNTNVGTLPAAGYAKSTPTSRMRAATPGTASM